MNDLDWGQKVSSREPLIYLALVICALIGGIATIKGGFWGAIGFLGGVVYAWAADAKKRFDSELPTERKPVKRKG